MKCFFSIAAIMVAVGFSSSVKAQMGMGGSRGPKPTIKVIDSISIAGVPVNRLVIRSINLSDSVATVSSALVYQGAPGYMGSQGGQMVFTDAIPITNTTNVSVASIAAMVARRRGVTIH